MRPLEALRRAMTATAAALLAGAVLGVSIPRAHATTEVVIEIRDYRFVPDRVTVKRGAVVRWVNQEKRTTHSVRFLGPQGFESERFFPGESWQRRFDQPGPHPYSCGPHPEMQGHIEVIE
jgi:plastocyanin